MAHGHPYICAGSAVWSPLNVSWGHSLGSRLPAPGVPQSGGPYSNNRGCTLASGLRGGYPRAGLGGGQPGTPVLMLLVGSQVLGCRRCGRGW